MDPKDAVNEPGVRTLELTPIEDTLARLLLDVAAYVDNAPTSPSPDSQVTLPDELRNEKLVLRFTGGWVRDKLLGVDSHDIDVAINKMTGYQFGLKLKEYLETPENPEKYGLEGVAKNDSQSNKAGNTGKNKIVGGLHKIEANPEKSKHLETVTTRILGLDIDLVNLRKETYSEDSRNPQMEFGTPEEDALRRDATVNAMFFNLNTRQIEDFTGKGHDDMKTGIIRTPLEPYQTFKDDPLRVLRLIRFASRLNYTIDPEAEHWMKDAEIKDALKAKISRERVGVELEKMLRGPDPYMAISLVDRLGLYETIFSDPTQAGDKHYQADTDQWTLVVETLKTFLESSSNSRDILIRDAEDNYLAWQILCMVPYRDAPQPPGEPGKKLPPPVASMVAREGIKATNKVCDIITASVRNHEEISMLVHKLSDQTKRPHHQVEGEDAAARDVLGMAIRRWGPTWRTQALFALLADVANDPQSRDTQISDYASFLDHLRELDILDAFSLKPLLDGKALAKALSTPPGPWMKDALDVVMAWQLRNPGKTTTEEAIEEVKNSGSHGELTQDLISHFLRLTIRPLFAKTRHPAVTATGRKATTTAPPAPSAFELEEEEMKPWKKRENRSALDLLRWVLQNSSPDLIEQHWPLLIPPLLSITDDHDLNFKTQGSTFINKFLSSAPPTLLPRTGLGDVFEAALMPCLGYLPTLTPEPESIALLSAAFPALINLSRKAHLAPDVTPPPGHKPSAEESARRRVKFLDAVLRKGVLAVYTHCPEHVKIVKVVLDNLCLVQKELAVESVKHFRYVLPMLSEVLGDPFGYAHPPTLIAALKVLQSCIVNGAPRIGFHRAEVLKGVCLCWVKLEEEEEEEGNGDGGLDGGVGDVREEARKTVGMLEDTMVAQGDEWDVRTEFGRLVAAEERLEGLLGDRLAGR